MSSEEMNFGHIAFLDLTVPNAEEVRDFYVDVVGWNAMPLGMEDADGAYEDYMIADSTGQRAAGICHARGYNLGVPPQWMIYTPVADMDVSMALVPELGGEIVKIMNNEAGLPAYVVIRDPAGAHIVLTRVEVQ